MPYTWVEAEPIVILDQSREIGAFHAYRDDYVEHGPREFRFVLRPTDGEEAAYDIRNWAGYNPGLSLAKNIKLAYALGAISFDEDDEPSVGWEAD